MKSIVGKWKILEMSMWDRDYIDLIEPGRIEFNDNGLGQLVFGAIYAEIDYRLSELNQVHLVECSFDGIDEGDPVSGRVKLVLEGDKLRGKIFFHCGDESELVAQKPNQQ